MKDCVKRIVIVLLILLAVIFVLDFFYTKYNYSDNTLKESNTQTQDTDKKEEEILPSDLDEVEKYENTLGRTTANLNLRDYPSTDGNISQTLPKNTILTIVAKVRTGWYKVSFNNKEGYVSNEYVKILTEEEKKEITIAQKYDKNTYAKVNIDTMLNIRERANKEANKLTSVKAGSVLKVYQRMENNWYLVEGNTILGYVSGEYIKILTEGEYNTYSSENSNLLIPEQNIIATYTSTSTYNKNSRYNMHLAADYMNETIISPGETYSHLNIVHPEGKENKYIESTIFVGDGKVGQGIGGGICQTSSTTYAAIVSAEEKGIKTGLNVTAQAPHSGKVNYVPRKYEATVNSGTQDFCFRNCNDYSIKIVTLYNHNTLTVTIYKI